MRDFAHSIVDTLRHPMILLDSAFRVEKANLPFYRSFHFTPDEVEGRLFFELQDGRWDVPALRLLLERVIPQDGHLENFEVWGDFTGEGERVMLLNARRVERADDGAQVILLALEDVTAQRKAQEELRRMNEELEKRVKDRTAELETANRELEAFCYSVSHDLRTPLRAIEGFSEELLQSYSDRLDENGQHYLTRIRAGSQRMATLIDDLLDLSRVSRAELRRERVDLSDLAAQVEQELRRQPSGREVTLRAQPGLTAWGDRRLLRLALDNLIGNAWKFTSKREQAEIELGCLNAEGEPTFFVRDNGAGFDMAYAGKLFGAFQRLHNEREFPGTGVGLATVQRIIHRHRGRIWAESAVDQGATFFFTLPSGEDR